jgi:hypothetical protein
MGQRWLSGDLARLRIQDDGRCLGVVESTCTAKRGRRPQNRHRRRRARKRAPGASTGNWRLHPADRTEAFRVDYVRMAAAQPTPEQGNDLDGGRLGVRQSVLCGLGLY